MSRTKHKPPTLLNVYAGIRKPGAPPTVVERDRRKKARDLEHAQEMKKYQGKRRGDYDGED